MCVPKRTEQLKNKTTSKHVHVYSGNLAQSSTVQQEMRKMDGELKRVVIRKGGEPEKQWMSERVSE